MNKLKVDLFQGIISREGKGISKKDGKDVKVITRTTSNGLKHPCYCGVIQNRELKNEENE